MLNRKEMEPSTSVASGKQDYVPSKNELFFPRCEYKARFKETSAFTMSDPDYWGTYFRSTPQGGNCDRIAKFAKSGSIFKNKNINKGPSKNKEIIPPSKSGCIKSPWVHPQYKEIFYTKSQIPKEINKDNSTLLYDQLLQYKISICATVVKRFLACKISDRKIDVYLENDYPCIMVQIKGLAELIPTGEQGSLYRIVIAYFTAITNSVAFSSNIPIELVIRASFGHNIPSVSETAMSFRISMGIVPESYAEVLAKSLKLLNDKFLVPLLNKDATKTTLKLDFSQEEIKLHNDEVNCYNEWKQLTRKSRRQSSRVKCWKEDDSLLNVLCEVGDSSGKKVSYQITRYKKYIDLLADYAHEHLLSLDDTKDFAKPLREMLKKLTYTNKVTLVNNNNDYNNSRYEFRDEENQDIKDDNKFWGIIQTISSIFEVLIGMKNLSDIINRKKIKGLYCLLERTHLETIRNSISRQCEDGYGSSSDCEVSVDDTIFYSMKITLATGMRAINLAQFLKIYLAGTQEIDTEYMYYETGNVMKNVQDIYQFSSGSGKKKEGVVKYIDLNHCAAKGPNSKVSLKEIKDNLNSKAVIVLDYTSATTEKISEAIRLFIKEVPVLLLVSSGLKNEQIGADINPYGTLRIITTNYKDLNKLDYILKAYLIAQEKLPQELHNIRKIYKDAGAVVTSAAIYTKDRGYDYKHIPCKNDRNIEYLTNVDILPDELNKIAVLLSDKYEEEYNNLTIEYGVSLKSIISWDLEKTKFLGSDKVMDVTNIFDDNKNIFDEIAECYDRDHNLTSDIVEEILQSEEYENITQLGMTFADLASEYEQIQAESDDGLLDENIIDIIVRKNSYDYDSFRQGFALYKAAGLIDSGWSTPVSSEDEYQMLDSDISSNISISSSTNDDNSEDNSMSSLFEGMDYAE